MRWLSGQAACAPSLPLQALQALCYGNHSTRAPHLTSPYLHQVYQPQEPLLGPCQGTSRSERASRPEQNTREDAEQMSQTSKSQHSLPLSPPKPTLQNPAAPSAEWEGWHEPPL